MNFYRTSNFAPANLRLDPFGGNSSSAQKSTQTTSSTAGANSPSTSGDSSPINAGAGSLTTIGSGAHVDVTADPAITQSAFDTISTVVQNALNSLGNVADTSSYTLQQQTQSASDAAANNDQNLAGILTTVLAADQATAANTASGGQTDTNKTVLWVVGIVAGVIGLIFFFRKK